MGANTHQPRGSVLTITLFILLVLGAMAVALATIVIIQLRSVTNYGLAYQAHFAADSGLERSLYYAQLARRTKTLGIAETATLLSTLTGSLGNNTSYSMSVKSDSDVLTAAILAGRATQIDVFAEDYSTGSLVLTGLANASNLSFNWDYDCDSATLTPQLEISLYRWEPTVWTDLTDPTVATHYVVNCIPPASGAATACEYRLGISSSFLYRVRMKALQCDATVSVSAHDTAENTIQLHSQLGFIASGSGASNHQGIRASALWHPPVNDYLDYVLFTEETLTK